VKRTLDGREKVVRGVASSTVAAVSSPAPSRTHTNKQYHPSYVRGSGARPCSGGWAGGLVAGWLGGWAGGRGGGRASRRGITTYSSALTRRLVIFWACRRQSSVMGGSLNGNEKGNERQKEWIGIGRIPCLVESLQGDMCHLIAL
jgi:predicted lipid-binding transport protein (Tim44 family)